MPSVPCMQSFCPGKPWGMWHPGCKGALVTWNLCLAHQSPRRLGKAGARHRPLQSGHSGAPTHATVCLPSAKPHVASKPLSSWRLGAAA